MLRRSRTEGRQRGGPAAPRRVLVAHDDADALELLRRVLDQAGYEVLPVPSIDRALAAVAAERPEAAVLDLGDAGANLKLLEAIRHHDDPAVSGVRVVLVASHGSNRMFSWQSGIDAFLAKPFHAGDLVAEVAAVLDRRDGDRPRHRRDELQRARAEGGRWS